MTLNVSVDGAFVVTSEPPAPGHLVHLSVILPQMKEAIPLQGMVMRSVSGEEARELTKPAGVGIHFYGLGERVRRVWEDFFHQAIQNHVEGGGLLDTTSGMFDAAPPLNPTEEDDDFFDEPTGKWRPAQPRSTPSYLSATEPIQHPRRWEQPVLYQVCPTDTQGLLGFRDQALASGGVMITGAAPRLVGSPAVVAVVHPKSRAEFHIPGEVQAAPPSERLVPVRFLSVTPRTIAEFEAFVDSACCPSGEEGEAHGPADKEMVLFEDADEAQWDLVVDETADAISVDNVLPLQTALNPFGGRSSSD